MSLRDAWNDGLDWAGEKLEDVKEYATDKAISIGTGIVMDNYKKSITDALGGPSKMTPELAAAGWKPGLDGIPYNPAIAYTAEDWANDQKNANANRAGRASGAVQQSAPAAELSQDLRQRTPSGTMYNPDLSAYNDSSLFDYKGPGGVSEYTYGQGLPTEGAGYDIWGTPTDVANPYYEGQFGEGYTTPEPGVADSAITLAPITMPAGVPQIPTSNTNTTTNNNTTTTTNTGPYQSGMDSNLLNSYINETGIGTATQGSGMGYTGGVNEPGIGTATQGSGMGYSGGANEVGIGTATQGSGMGYSGGANEAGAVGIPGYTNNGTTSASDQAIFDAATMSQMPDSGPSIYDTQYTQGANNQMTAIGPSIYDTQYTNTSGMQFPADESGIAGTQQQFPANTVINPFEDSMSQPIVGQSDAGTLNSMGYYSPPNAASTFPGGYNDTTSSEPTYIDPNNTGSNYEYANTLNEGQQQLQFQESVPDNTLYDFSVYEAPAETYVPEPQYGLDEAVIDGYKYITNLFSGGEPSAEEVANSVDKEPSIWNSVMETIAGSAGMGFPGPGESKPVVAQAEPIVPAIQPNQNMYQYDGIYANAEGSNAAIDEVVANSMAQDQAVAQANQAAYTGPSIFTQPAAPAPVFGPAPRPTPAPAPRPAAPAGGYSTKQYNNNFATRRDVRNLFA